jgi:MFS family permease
VSGLLGGLISYPVLNYMDGTLGLAGWRWLFLIEGAPTVFLGIIAWYYYTHFSHHTPCNNGPISIIIVCE